MTLAIGDKVVKLDRSTGKPVGKYEAYVEFEVIDLSPTFGQLVEGVTSPEEARRAESWEQVQFAKLRKVR